MRRKVLALLLVYVIASCNASDDIDSVLNLLLNSDGLSDNVSETEEPVIDASGDQPYLEGDIWKCGNCDVTKGYKLIYTESNDVDTNNISEDEPVVVQVGLNIENMQCVEVVAGGNTTVRRESGVCAGDGVTLAVYNSKHFLVHVYGG